MHRNGAPPVFAVPRFFLRGPALYPVPHPGPRFLRGTVRGPAIASKFRISGTKLSTISGALDSAPQKTGPRSGDLAGGSKNGAPDGARGGVKKKRSPAPPRSAVRGGDFLRGPACPEANTTPAPVQAVARRGSRNALGCNETELPTTAFKIACSGRICIALVGSDGPPTVDDLLIEMSLDEGGLI